MYKNTIMGCAKVFSEMIIFKLVPENVYTFNAQIYGWFSQGVEKCEQTEY